MSKRTVKSAAPETHPSQTDNEGSLSGVPEETDRRTVAELAWLRWVENGCPSGTADEDWFEAEKQLKSRTRHAG